MKIYESDNTAIVDLGLHHPDDSSRYISLAVVATWDEVLDDNFYQTIAEEIWEQFNSARYWHYITLTFTYVIENIPHTVIVEYHGHDEITVTQEKE